ncbi:MAG: hypothetical protein KGL39_16720 [Patescibacteria group bacterium]|nr:hypothetical protein [Patescibacteria group bacterium]
MILYDANGLKTEMSRQGAEYVFNTVQDCTPIAERAKEMHNTGQFGGSDMRLAASIPNVMIDKYCNDNGITYRDFCTSQEHKKRLLTDPALDHFRVWKGKL